MFTSRPGRTVSRCRRTCKPACNSGTSHSALASRNQTYSTPVLLTSPEKKPQAVGKKCAAATEPRPPKAAIPQQNHRKTGIHAGALTEPNVPRYSHPPTHREVWID